MNPVALRLLNQQPVAPRYRMMRWDEGRRLSKETDAKLIRDSQGEIYEEMIRDFIAIDFEMSQRAWHRVMEGLSN